jgi:hypothetical protein
MIEGLWSVEFKSNIGIFGGGVVVLQRVFGGDSKYTYLGTYVVEHDHIWGAVKVTPFSSEPYSVFGDSEEFHLNIDGKVGQRIFVAQGFR